MIYLDKVAVDILNDMLCEECQKYPATETIYKSDDVQPDEDGRWHGYPTKVCVECAEQEENYDILPLL